LRVWSQRTNAPEIDKRKAAERKIKLLEQAEATLLDSSKRSRYDQDLANQPTQQKPDLESMELHPDEEVAMGAAIQGMMLQAEAGMADLVERETFPLVQIQGVNSHSLGVLALDDFGKEKNLVILARNTPYASRVSYTVRTIADRQTELHVKVTEGEDSDPKFVKVIGDAMMRIPQYPKGAPFEVFFEYDQDGVVKVTVFDATATKALGEMVIKRKSNLTEGDVQEKQQELAKVAVN
jgi:molecular chaperone DnaK